MREFFKGLWIAIKVLLCVGAIALICWLGYNLCSFFKNGKWSEAFQNVISSLQINGGKGNVGVDGKSDDVPDEEKGLTDKVSEDDVNNFDDYLDWINDKTNNDDNTGSEGGSEGEEGGSEKEYWDKDDYLPKDMITSDEFKQSNGNIIKTFKYHGKDYLYYSMVFYTDNLKSDKIRFFGYFPASDFKIESDKLIYLIPSGTVKLFKLASDLNSWFNKKYPEAEISYHYFSNLKQVYQITPNKLSKSAYLNFSFDDYKLYLTHDEQILRVMRGSHKFLGFINVQPKQYEFFEDLADYFIYDNKFEYDQIYTCNFGKHFDYVGSPDRVKMDFLIKEWVCPCQTTNEVLSDWVITKEPTCQASGEKQRLCYLCGKTTTEEVEPRDHYYNDAFEVVSSTCTEHGHSSQKCKWCDDIYTLELPLDEHDYMISSHFESEGCEGIEYIHKVCKNCGHIEDEELPYEIHLREEYVLQAPTCTETGIKSFRCKDCHIDLSDSFEFKQVIIPALGHDWGDWYVDWETGNGGICKRVCNNDSSHVETKQNDYKPELILSVGDTFNYSNEIYEIISIVDYSDEERPFDDLYLTVPLGYECLPIAFPLRCIKNFTYKRQGDETLYWGFYSVYKFSNSSILFNGYYYAFNGGIVFSNLKTTDEIISSSGVPDTSVWCLYPSGSITHTPVEFVGYVNASYIYFLDIENKLDI